MYSHKSYIYSVQCSVSDGYLPDLREAPLVPADLLVVLDPPASGQLVYKLLVVSDNHQLEVPLPGSLSNDLTQSSGQAVDVLSVQVGGRLVQGDNATVGGECLGQGKSDDQTGENLLTSGTPTSHVQL